jgi:hypothetical protein
MWTKEEEEMLGSVEMGGMNFKKKWENIKKGSRKYIITVVYCIVYSRRNCCCIVYTHTQQRSYNKLLMDRQKKKKNDKFVFCYSRTWRVKKEKKKTQHSTTEIPIHRIRRYGNQLKTIVSHLSLYIVYQGTSLVLLRNNKMSVSVCICFFFSGGFYWVVHRSARRDQISFF